MLLLGAGELGKEVAIEAQRLGVEVIAADRYANAPAMQVAHRSHVINMLDPQALRALALQEQPSLIVPEIEAIATPVLLELEAEGFRVRLLDIDADTYQTAIEKGVTVNATARMTDDCQKGIAKFLEK